MIRLLILLILIGFSCSGRVDRSSKSQFEINQILKSGKRFFVQDSTQYSPDFINELKTLDSQYDSVRLIGKDLIINKSYTTEIPVELPLNKIVNYQVVKGDTTYKLGLKRINFTTIDYNFELNNKLIKTGKATLTAGFFLGEETVELDNNEVVPVSQYVDEEEIWTRIQIEIGNGNRVDYYMKSNNDSTKNYINVPILLRK